MLYLNYRCTYNAKLKTRTNASKAMYFQKETEAIEMDVRAHLTSATNIIKYTLSMMRAEMCVRAHFFSLAV